jgi:spermidine synthase
VTRIFECGIGTNFEDVPSNMSSMGTPGASLRMWESYFPNAEIIGADIDQRVLFTTNRIKTFELDQTNPESIRKFLVQVGEGKFDLMIDDGLHNLQAAQSLFENSFTQLKDNGVYVIEDVSPWSLGSYIDWLDSLNMNFSVVPLFGMQNIPSDDLLIVIRKS